MMTQPAVLVLDNIGKIHDDGSRTTTTLDSVSLTVEAGELVAVMGPSGAGKSTLLNIAGTLDTPTRGRVLIDGCDTSGFSAKERARVRRESVGFVFQDFNLIPTLTASENVGLPLELSGMTRKACEEQAAAALEAIGLPNAGDSFPAELSGGERQRVAIARALIGDRRLLLADEPTGALDTTTGEAIMTVLRSRIDQGAVGLLVTHEPRFAAYADRTVYLRDGRLQGDQ